jgi:hypothetical protein
VAAGVPDAGKLGPDRQQLVAMASTWLTPARLEWGMIVVMARGVPSTRYAQSVDAKIAYQVSGDGPVDLVLLPGLVSHVELAWQQPTYRRFVGLPQRRCRLICFDKRGTGLPDPTDSPADHRHADRGSGCG